MELRLATALDLEAIAAIYNAAVLGGTATWESTPVDIPERRRWLEAHPPDRHPVLVGIEAGQVVAWGCLSPYRHGAGWSATVEVSVYVAKGWQGGGRGAQLLDALCQWGGGAGHDVALACVSADNAASLRMCRAEGFWEAGRLVGVGHKFGRTLDAVLLQRFLRRRAGVVLDDGAGRTLFIRRSRGGQVWWTLPGGGVEPGETPEAAAARELLEETGLGARVGRLGYRVFFRGRLQLYYQASEPVRLATGPSGPEVDPAHQASRGTYTPQWLGAAEVAARRCLPPAVADAIAARAPWPSRPVTVHDA